MKKLLIAGIVSICLLSVTGASTAAADGGKGISGGGPPINAPSGPTQPVYPTVPVTAGQGKGVTQGDLPGGPGSCGTTRGCTNETAAGDEFSPFVRS